MSISGTVIFRSSEITHYLFGWDTLIKTSDGWTYTVSATMQVPNTDKPPQETIWELEVGAAPTVKMPPNWYTKLVGWIVLLVGILVGFFSAHKFGVLSILLAFLSMPVSLFGFLYLEEWIKPRQGATTPYNKVFFEEIVGLLITCLSTGEFSPFRVAMD